jgi:hypothetical protein
MIPFPAWAYFLLCYFLFTKKSNVTFFRYVSNIQYVSTTNFEVKMDWELLGFKRYPFSVDPIKAETIDLFTGHEEEINLFKSILKDVNVRLVIEGARGVGTTSFANFLKFTAQFNHLYLSPRDEVSVGKDWNLEALLTAVISTIVRELEISQTQRVKNNKVFLEAKALCNRLSEAYNAFGITAFSVGGNFGRSVSVTQPTFVPATALKFHLEDLGKLAVKLGYKNGLLIQLNNLDVNVIHSEEHLAHLFNAVRDYLQIANISWFLVGDIGLRSFIARRVDRLDDIISYDVSIKPLDKKLYHELIHKRLAYYSLKRKTEFPFNAEIFDYIYDVSEGRLRYVFGLVYAMSNRLHLGKIVQNISLELAKSTITALAQERLQKKDLSKGEVTLVKKLVKVKEASVVDLAEVTKRNRTFISRTMNKLLLANVVEVRQERNKRFYRPSLDAKIALA